MPKLVVSAKNSGILQTRIDEIGDHMEMNLTIFKYKNECYRVEKVDEKWGHFSSFSSFQVSFVSYDPQFV